MTEDCDGGCQSPAIFYTNTFYADVKRTCINISFRKNEYFCKGLLIPL